jgi:peptidylprolyl isomerase
MNKEHYIAVGAALAVVILFFVVMGGGWFNASAPAATITSNKDEGNGVERFALPPTISMQDVTELKIEDEVVGTGAEAAVGSTVTVEYTGAFTSGTVFDTSRGKSPFSFTIGKDAVIEGWHQGLVGMKVGGKRMLVIPPSLGYGPNDYGPIPGGSTLVFEVELLDVK